MAADFDFDHLLAFARAEESVFGLVLLGSRGRGVGVDELSDWDVCLVCRDDAAVARMHERFPSGHGSRVEVFPCVFEALREVATAGSPDDWTRYLYAHLTPLVDRTDGELQGVLDAMEYLPEGVREQRAASLADACVNSTYRALRYGTRLDAVEAVPALLASIFALEGRVRPYNKYLEWELEHHPLPGWPRDETMPLVEAALAGEHEALRTLFRRLERHVRAAGFGAVIDGWEPDVAWLRGEATYRG